MSYTVLYRKYRPSDFSEIDGQKILVKTLKNAVVNDKISHAYLFFGPSGTGKTSLAKLFGNSINCLNIKDGEPCKKCSVCLQIANKTYGDIIEIDAASNNGVDEIREIISKVDLVPSNGKYKIYIIDEVHMLSTGAFNALLKTLEEPPRHVIFILATTEPHKVPVTISSRCQSFEFKKIAIDDITSRLKKIIVSEKINIEDEAVLEIARIAAGGMREAINILDQVMSYSNEKITVELVNEITGTINVDEMNNLFLKIEIEDLEEVLKMIDAFDRKGKDIYKITEKILLKFKEILLNKKIPNYFPGNNSDTFKNFEEDRIYTLVDEFNELLTKMKKSDYPRMLLDIVILKNLKKANCGIKNRSSIVLGNEKKVKAKEKINIPAGNVEKKESKEKDFGGKNSEYEGVKEKKTEQKNKNITKKHIEELKNIRINNTLALANKDIKKDIIEKWDLINKYSLDSEYGAVAVLLMDGVVQVASEDYMIITYKYENSTLRANYSMDKIEKLLRKIIEKPYKFIAITYEEWVKIKDEYITKIRRGEKYELFSEKKEIIEEITKKEEKNSTSNSLKVAKDTFKEDIIEII